MYSFSLSFFFPPKTLHKFLWPQLRGSKKWSAFSPTPLSLWINAGPSKVSAVPVLINLSQCIYCKQALWDGIQLRGDEEQPPVPRRREERTAADNGLISSLSVAILHTASTHSSWSSSFSAVPWLQRNRERERETRWPNRERVREREMDFKEPCVF